MIFPLWKAEFRCYAEGRASKQINAIRGITEPCHVTVVHDTPVFFATTNLRRKAPARATPIIEK